MKIQKFGHSGCKQRVELNVILSSFQIFGASWSTLANLKGLNVIIKKLLGNAEFL